MRWPFAWWLAEVQPVLIGGLQWAGRSESITTPASCQVRSALRSLMAQASPQPCAGVLRLRPRALGRLGGCRLRAYASRVSVSYTHLRAHETRHDLVCRLLLE